MAFTALGSTARQSVPSAPGRPGPDTASRCRDAGDELMRNRLRVKRRPVVGRQSDGDCNQDAPDPIAGNIFYHLYLDIYGIHGQAYRSRRCHAKSRNYNRADPPGETCGIVILMRADQHACTIPIRPNGRSPHRHPGVSPRSGHCNLMPVTGARRLKYAYFSQRWLKNKRSPTSDIAINMYYFKQFRQIRPPFK